MTYSNTFQGITILSQNKLVFLAFFLRQFSQLLWTTHILGKQNKITKYTLTWEQWPPFKGYWKVISSKLTSWLLEFLEVKVWGLDRDSIHSQQTVSVFCSWSLPLLIFYPILIRRGADPIWLKLANWPAVSYSVFITLAVNLFETLRTVTLACMHWHFIVEEGEDCMKHKKTVQA